MGVNHLNQDSYVLDYLFINMILQTLDNRIILGAVHKLRKTFRG